MSEISDKDWEELQHMSIRDLIFNPLARENMHYEYITDNVIKFTIFKKENNNGN